MKEAAPASVLPLPVASCEGVAAHTWAVWPAPRRGGGGVAVWAGRGQTRPLALTEPAPRAQIAPFPVSQCLSGGKGSKLQELRASRLPAEEGKGPKGRG